MVPRDDDRETQDDAALKLASRTAFLLALLLALAAAEGLLDRSVPLDCARPAGPLRCEAAPCTLRCSAPGSWREFPYLTIDGDTSGAALLRWSAVQALELEPGVPANAGARWDGPIGAVELVLAGDWTLRGVSLHTRLRPLQRLQLLLHELAAPQPYVAASNNTTPPRIVLQSSLIAWTGLASLLAILLVLWRTPRGAPTGWPFAVLLAGFLVTTLGPLASLASHAGLAVGHSALQGSLRDEEAARYGEPFAQLADVLRARVPPGALVLFPRDREHPDESEAHWMDFHFWPAYRSVPQEGDRPAYVFWYRPLLLRRAQDRILDASGRPLLRVAPVATLDDGRALLRVLP